MKLRSFYIQYLASCATILALSVGYAQMPAKKVNPSVASEDGKLILAGPSSKEQFRRSMPEGPRTGGGGNSCSLAISENSKQLLATLKLMPNLLTKKQTAQLESKISSAVFFVKDNLVKNGESKDAMNFPEEDKIIFSPRICKTELIEVSGRSMGLLLHEYLGLMKVDDSKYDISGKFLSLYAELASAAPMIGADFNQEFQHAAVVKFLKEANDPKSKVGKVIQANQEPDGRNWDGTIELPITKNSIQVVLVNMGQIYPSRYYFDRSENGLCVDQRSNAIYEILLSKRQEVHSAFNFSVLRFRVSVYEEATAQLPKNDKKANCGTEYMLSRRAPEITYKTKVSDIEFVKSEGR